MLIAFQTNIKLTEIDHKLVGPLCDTHEEIPDNCTIIGYYVDKHVHLVVSFKPARDLCVTNALRTMQEISPIKLLGAKSVERTPENLVKFSDLLHEWIKRTSSSTPLRVAITASRNQHTSNVITAAREIYRRADVEKFVERELIHQRILLVRILEANHANPRDTIAPPSYQFSTRLCDISDELHAEQPPSVVIYLQVNTQLIASASHLQSAVDKVMSALLANYELSKRPVITIKEIRNNDMVLLEITLRGFSEFKDKHNLDERVRDLIHDNGYEKFLRLNAIRFINQSHKPIRCSHDSKWFHEFVEKFTKGVLWCSITKNPSRMVNVTPFFGKFLNDFVEASSDSNTVLAQLWRHRAMVRERLYSNELFTVEDRLCWMMLMCLMSFHVESAERKQLFRYLFPFYATAIESSDPVYSTAILTCALVAYSNLLATYNSNSLIKTLEKILNKFTQLKNDKSENYGMAVLLLNSLLRDSEILPKQKTIFYRQIHAISCNMNRQSLSYVVIQVEMFCVGSFVNDRNLLSESRVAISEADMPALLVEHEWLSGNSWKKIFDIYFLSVIPIGDQNRIKNIAALLPLALPVIRNMGDSDHQTYLAERIGYLITSVTFTSENSSDYLRLLVRLFNEVRDVSPTQIRELFQTLVSLVIANGHFAYGYEEYFAVMKQLGVIARRYKSPNNEILEVIDNIEEILSFEHLRKKSGVISARNNLCNINRGVLAQLRDPNIDNSLRSIGIPVLSQLTRFPPFFIFRHRNGGSLCFRDFPYFGNAAFSAVMSVLPGEQERFLGLIGYLSTDSAIAEYGDGTTAAHLAALRGDLIFFTNRTAEREDKNDYGITPQFLLNCVHPSISNKTEQQMVESLIASVASCTGFDEGRTMIALIMFRLRNMKNQSDINALTIALFDRMNRFTSTTVIDLIYRSLIETIRVKSSCISEDQFIPVLRTVIGPLVNHANWNDDYVEYFLRQLSYISTSSQEVAPICQHLYILLNTTLHSKTQTDFINIINFLTQSRNFDDDEGIHHGINSIMQTLDEYFSAFARDEMFQEMSRCIQEAVKTFSLFANNSLSAKQMNQLLDWYLSALDIDRQPVSDIKDRTRMILWCANFSMVSQSLTSELLTRALNRLFHHVTTRTHSAVVIELGQFCDEASVQFPELMQPFRIKIEKIAGVLRIKLNKKTSQPVAATTSTPVRQRNKFTGTGPGILSFLNARTLSDKDFETIQRYMSTIAFPGAVVWRDSENPKTIYLDVSLDEIPEQKRTRLKRLGIIIDTHQKKPTLFECKFNANVTESAWRDHFCDEHPIEKKVDAVHINKTQPVEATSSSSAIIDEPSVTSVERVIGCITRFLGLETTQIAHTWLIEYPFKVSGDRNNKRCRLVINPGCSNITVGSTQFVNPTVLMKSFCDAFKKHEMNVGCFLGSLGLAREYPNAKDNGGYLLDQAVLQRAYENSDEFVEVAKTFRLILPIADREEKFFSREQPRSVKQEQSSSTQPNMSFEMWARLVEHNDQTNELNRQGISFHLGEINRTIDLLQKSREIGSRKTLIRVYALHVMCLFNLFSESYNRSMPQLRLCNVRNGLRHTIEQLNFENLFSNTHVLLNALHRIDTFGTNVKNDIASHDLKPTFIFLVTLADFTESREPCIDRIAAEESHLNELVRLSSHGHTELCDIAIACCVMHSAAKSTKIFPDEIRTQIAAVSAFVGHSSNVMRAESTQCYQFEKTLSELVKPLQASLMNNHCVNVKG